MSNTEIVEERGEYRATIRIDQYPTEPENEYGCPVLRIDGHRVTFTGYGSLSAKADGVTTMDTDDALTYFINTSYGVNEGVENFARWLRIFHGGDAVGYHLGYSRDYGYVAYTTSLMAQEGWGHTPETLTAHPEYLVPELSEWQAYCEGDVYIHVIQRKVKRVTGTLTLDGDVLSPLSDHEVWQDEEICGGYYGEKYAREAAIEALDGYVKDTDYRCTDEGIFHDLHDWECKRCAFVVEPGDRVTA